ncbi:hypothetical protein GCM10023079_29650 [Streptomyces chitinivorans]
MRGRMPGGHTDPMIKVLVAEDMHVVRAGLAEILDGQLGIEVAGQAADGPAALEAALRHGPDVVVLDIDLPGRSGRHLGGRTAAREASGVPLPDAHRAGPPRTVTQGPGRRSGGLSAEDRHAG